MCGVCVGGGDLPLALEYRRLWHRLWQCLRQQRFWFSYQLVSSVESVATKGNSHHHMSTQSTHTHCTFNITIISEAVRVITDRITWYCGGAYESCNGERRSIDLAHIESFQYHFIERGISAASQKPVQLSKDYIYESYESFSMFCACLDQ